jgi:Ran GTPase-activating protein 1
VADYADIFTGRLISEIPQAIAALCDALIDKQHLIEIDLSDNAFGGRVVEPLVPFLSRNRSFQIFKLNNNGLGPAGGTVIADALRASAETSAAEGKKSNLRIVVCGRNRLEDGSANAWAAAFRAHGTLEEVHMPQNGIRMDGIAALAAGLAENSALAHLDLQDNTFSADGERAFAVALSKWPKLHTLNFSDCVLSDEGEVPTIVTALAGGSNPALRRLLLQNNNLDARTLAVLSGAIGTHLARVTRIEFQANDVEEDNEEMVALAENMTARGGCFLFDDDDDEEEEEVGAEDEEPEAVPLAPGVAVEIEKVLGSEAAKKATDTDELADLLGKVSLN